MEMECTTSVGLRRSVLAAAIALTLCSPVYAAGTQSTASHYDSAVAYTDYLDQKASYKLRASDLIGRQIQNANNDDIGEIDDLIVSRDGDKVMAIISLDGVLNLNSKLVAIPYQELRVTKDGKHVYYNTTKEKLQGMPAFAYAGGERSMKTTPMDDKGSAVDAGPAPIVAQGAVQKSAADTSKAPADRSMASEAKAADNSAHNADDDAGDLTPLDQSHSEADVDLTRSIRKALVDDDTLGTNAQNVKVITVNGMVTLRGPVASSDERSRIVAIAKKAAGPDRVTDDLQVIDR